MIRDYQQGRVRAAERLVRSEVSEWSSVDELRDFVQRLQNSRWHHKRFGPAIPVLLEIHNARRWHYRMGMILVGRKTLNRWNALHETAHHLVGVVHGHDAAYTSTYLMLVRRWLGRDAWRQLRQAYRLHRVHYRSPNGLHKRNHTHEAQAADIPSVRGLDDR